MRCYRLTRDRWWVLGIMLLLGVQVIALGGDRTGRGDGRLSRETVEGRDLFTKNWNPGEISIHGGDGLGPLYNEKSCVGCHNLGGTGGAGGADRDVLLLSAVAVSPGSRDTTGAFKGELESLHPGFHSKTSIVLHRHATSVEDQLRLDKIGQFTQAQTREELFDLRRTRRNTPALFGLGLVDRLRDEDILAMERRTFPRFPEIKGRVSRTSGGQLGRFGWKGQVASLEGFVLAACSNELGLEIPGLHQASLASTKDFHANPAKLDMEQSECWTLTQFVSTLAPPVSRVSPRTISYMEGRQVFDAIGCATCHAPRLGKIEGVYSDLLLHDMGSSLSDSGVYYGGGVPTPTAIAAADAAGAKPKVTGPATISEWRTPPLWGIADSAPYLHDGRASNLDDAIRLHSGEAARMAELYQRLSQAKRHALLTFLLTLKSPPAPGSGRASGKVVAAASITR